MAHFVSFFIFIFVFFTLSFKARKKFSKEKEKEKEKEKKRGRRRRDSPVMKDQGKHNEFFFAKLFLTIANKFFSHFLRWLFRVDHFQYMHCNIFESLLIFFEQFLVPRFWFGRGAMRRFKRGA